MNLFSLLTISMLSGNIILTKFLGICPFIGVSNEKESAVKMGFLVTLVTTIASIISYFVYNELLVKTGTEYMQIVVYILIIAGLVQLLEVIIKKVNRNLHKQFGIYLPLITTNCAILGTLLINTNNNYDLSHSIISSIGSGLGFTFVIYLFSSMRGRIDDSYILKRFRGIPIALITAAIMAMLFTRYIGG